MPGRKSGFEIVPDIEMKNYPQEMWKREIWWVHQENKLELFQELTQPITREKKELVRKKEKCYRTEISCLDIFTGQVMQINKMVLI